MTRFRAAVAALLLLCLAAGTAGSTYAARADDDDGNRRIGLEDDCDPSAGAGWNPSPPGPPGGCQQKRGNVSVAEFGAELDSPLAAAVVGHQSWRIDPSYLVIKLGKSLRVKNTGGRPHTFTEVNEFGAGANFVPPAHNEGLTANMPNPCAMPVELGPGDSAKLEGLTVGDHRFICCFHPWMRALITVQPGRSGGGDD